MEPLLGSLLLVPYNFAPAGWAFCDGALQQINSNNALFALIGTTFGGDGKTTFGLPKMKGPVEGTKWIICVTNGVFPNHA